MPQTLFFFDFGVNEEAAQQARHRLEGWRQAFRLGDRLRIKFERQSPSPSTAAEPVEAEPAKTKKGKGKSAGEGKTADSDSQKTQATDSERLRLMVRLEFSNHEKLSYQQWIGRIEAEPLLQGTDRQVWQRGQDGFDKATETFDSLP